MESFWNLESFWKNSAWVSIYMAKFCIFWQSWKLIERILANRIFCQTFVWWKSKLKDSFQYPTPAAYGYHFPDYKNFPCSNATMLQGFLGLWSRVLLACAIAKRKISVSKDHPVAKLDNGLAESPTVMVVDQKQNSVKIGAY